MPYFFLSSVVKGRQSSKVVSRQSVEVLRDPGTGARTRTRTRTKHGARTGPGTNKKNLKIF